MLLVQEFLKTHSLEDLKEQHAINIRHSKDESKICLNYDMLESKDDDALACQCRGLVLDAKTFEILNYGFDRFFNYGQGAASEIDFGDPSIKVLEKLDGTCTNLYFDQVKNEWHVSTRSIPEADMQVYDTPYTFRTLFEEGCKNSTGLNFDGFTKILNKDNTYIFELTSYYNRVVCIYTETSITLLGARNKKSLQELHLSEIDIPCPKVKEFPFKSLIDISAWVNEQKGTEYEGVVVLTQDFKRVKIKNAKYLLLHRAKDALVRSDRSALEAVLLGNYDDLIPLVPQSIVDKLLGFKDAVPKFIKTYDSKYNEMVNSLPQDSSKKDLALLIQKSGLWETPLYLRMNKKCSSTSDFIEKSKKNGTWTPAFLDSFMEYL